LYAFLISSMRNTYLAHFIFLDLIALIIFYEAFKLRSSLLCSLLQSPATSSPLGQIIFLSILFSNIPNLTSVYVTYRT
jgi:hypothetical protein